MVEQDKRPFRQIGRSQRPFAGAIERAKLIEFAQGLHLQNPIHFDVKAAREAGYRDIVAPPGFIMSFTLQPREEKIEVFKIDQRRALVGELQWRQMGVVCAGDELHGQSVLTDVARTSGRRPAEVLTIETRFSNQQGDLMLIFTEKNYEFLEGAEGGSQ